MGILINYLEKNKNKFLMALSSLLFMSIQHANDLPADVYQSKKAQGLHKSSRILNYMLTQIPHSDSTPTPTVFILRIV